MQREKNTVYVCLSTNDKWAPFAAVTIASIMSNTKSDVHFFVLYSELSQKNIDRINSVLKKTSGEEASNVSGKASNASIDYISINVKHLQNFNSNIPYITSDTFSKILFPNVKNDIEKVIYTDIDVVFKGDIAELFKEDLEGYIIGAVEGISHADGQDNIRLKIDKQHSYFQAGLLLIDCKKWREVGITSRCCEVARNFPKLRYGDQDILNIVFANDYKKLHQKYCVIPFQLAETQSFSEDSREALRKPFIIHYAGGNKPWITSGPLENDFWRYAAVTDFFPDVVKMRLNNDFVSKERDVTTRQYKLFGIIPLMKIKRKFMYSQITERYFLFNFIRIFKKVDDPDSVTWTSFFGVPILRLTKNKNER